jgi:hypothetical protein
MKWWQKLIYIVVIAMVIVGLIFGLIFAIFWGIEKFSQPKVIKEVQAVAEITAVKAESIAETTAVEEKVLETVVETSAKAPFIPEGQIPAYTSSIDGRPENGTELYSDVGYDEIWCATFGPGEFLGVVFPGGEKRGTIVIQLGPTTVGGDKVHYVITNLLPGCGWQGNWHYNDRLVTEKDWMAIKNLKVKEMMGSDNATDSLGCNVVDVVVAQAGKIIFQETYQKQ